MPSSAHRSAAARQLRPRLGRLAGVLAPHVPAAGAPVAADRDQQRGGPPARTARAPAAGSRCPAGMPSQPQRRHHSIRRRRPGTPAPPGRAQALPGDLQPELVQAAERGQVRAGEGSVRHVEVFRMGGVRTPIIGRPRPLPGHRRADHRYTLNCEEPLKRPAPPKYPLPTRHRGGEWVVKHIVAVMLWRRFVSEVGRRITVLGQARGAGH